MKEDLHLIFTPKVNHVVYSAIDSVIREFIGDVFTISYCYYINIKTNG